MAEDVDINWPKFVFDATRFTAQDAVAGSGMTRDRLHKWTHTALRRYFPLRPPGVWQRYSFADVVMLCVAQNLLDLGISSAQSFAWADEAARGLGVYRAREYRLSILIYRTEIGETRFVLVDAVGKEAAVQVGDYPLAVIINVFKLASQVMQRLIAAGAVEGPYFEGDFSKTLFVSLTPEKQRKQPALSSARRRPRRSRVGKK